MFGLCLGNVCGVGVYEVFCCLFLLVVVGEFIFFMDESWSFECDFGYFEYFGSLLF